MSTKLNLAFVCSLGLTLLACSSGDSGSPAQATDPVVGQPDRGGAGQTPSSDEPQVLTGVFLDSPVANIDYRTASRVAVTNAKGEFSYLPGERVTFAIGDLALPAVAAAPIVTPLDMSTEERINDEVTNIIRLLQSLDVDGNPENGITISEQAKLNATQVIFAQTIADFAASTAVTQLLPNAGLTITRIGLIPVIDAISHLESQLARLQDTIDPGADGDPVTPDTRPYDPASPSGLWVLEATAENGLESPILVSFVSDDNLLVTRRCSVDGQMTDVLLQGTWQYNDSNGVISTFIVRSADQVCDSNTGDVFSTRRLSWRDGTLQALSPDGQVYPFSR
ncbi:MAG: hypothetical protein CME36_01270 [unclassified Hahellaceae]|nr:hypothetical protein [Hahellaceae bacterium]|tara:strand:+ start:10793 stop:11803 length:1011 start_codon:yes stop_codon:yes gene_type:complete